MTYRTVMHPNGRLEKVLARTVDDSPIVDLSMLTDDELKRECKESLALMVRHAKGDLKALGAVRELLDRLEGKPIARTDINVRSQAILVIEASGD